MEQDAQPVSQQPGGAGVEDTPAGSAGTQAPPSTDPRSDIQASAPIEAPPADLPAAADSAAPSAVQQPPVRRRGPGRTLLIAGIIAVFLISALGGAGVYANGQLSATYSPQRAVTDYFAAMSRGDVAGMMSNATFRADDQTYAQFFGKDAVTGMMALDQNRQISGVSVSSTRRVDDSTSQVSVSLTWGGTAKSLTYTVRKDTARVHYLFYDSWRVVIPLTTITATLPKQPGTVQVDGLTLPSSSQSVAEAIQGFHQVTMLVSNFYDQSSQVIDGTGTTETVAFPTKISSAAVASAADSIKRAFAGVQTGCDPKKYFNCPNHNYTVAAGEYDVLKAIGGDINAYTSWHIAFSGDPTAKMVLVITDQAGKATASGTCAMTLTVDGNRTYHFTGTWTANLTWSGGGFGSDVNYYCDSKRA